MVRLHRTLFLTVLLASSHLLRAQARPASGADSSGWFRTAVEHISREEYHITFSTSDNAYQSPNRAQNLRFLYRPDGFTVHPRTAKIPIPGASDRTIAENATPCRAIDEWNVAMRVAGYGRSRSLRPFTGKSLLVHGAAASVDGNGMTIEYRNGEDGMRQNFIVKERPRGSGPLRVDIDATTELRLRVGAGCVAFVDASSETKLQYRNLQVWDADQRRLAAHFELKGSNAFSIVVDDHAAAYPVTIDPLSATANWSAECNQASARFGFSVSAAGDVNGDGYGDVIVGAPYYDNGQSDEGRAFVYYGSAAGLSGSANWSMECNQASARFGYAVSTAGDVNGDGCSDVIVGAYTYDNGQTDEGRVFVYYGSASGLSGGPDWTAESNQAGANFGSAVSTAGDLNGDGYSDVIVGADTYDNGQTDEGRAYVYYGSAIGLAGSAVWTAECDQANAHFGYAVSAAGDVNGDGYSDVIIGAYDYDNGQSDEGRAFVYYGGASGLSPGVNWSAEGDQTSARFGTSVAGAGDVNGDGYSDVIVGAFTYTTDQASDGRAFVYYGSASGLSAVPDWSAHSDQADAGFGYAVSTAGDVNGDGYSDVIVGAYTYDDGEADEGQAFVYYGSANGLSIACDWSVESDQAGAYFGRSVSTAGDVNGDGYSDVIVGAYSYSNGESFEGRSFVYNGCANGLSASVNWSAESNQAGAQFGLSVAGAGDVNGDGYSDVIVGAPFYDNGQSDEGRAFVYYGSAAGLSGTANWSAESNQASSMFGGSVASAGDVNGDGYGDVIVGAFLCDYGEVNVGRAFVYYGGASGLSASANWTVVGNQADARLGVSVSTAGDVNGDGYSDVIIGVPYYNTTELDGGMACLYLGSASGLSTTASWTAKWDQPDARFGVSVSTAGDVNGDGFSDVIVGAYCASNVETWEGRAYVYHGSASGLSTWPNWIGESNQANAQYGIRVATAGDVNGDGYSDVIIGANCYTNGETAEGRAFVYYGSGSGLSAAAAWTAEGDQTSAAFGYSVAAAGDVNGDGYSDVIVGASSFDNGQTDEGRAFVYYGSASGLSPAANWTAEGDQASAQFGSAVAGAGDVNGDGYSDVIIGAWSYDNGESNEGKAFVYYGNAGTGARSNLQQYRNGTATIIGPHGKTGASGTVRLSGFARGTFGRADGKLIYTYAGNGDSFGSIVNASGAQPAYSDLGSSVNGIQLNADVSGIPTGTSYRWRARVKYSPVNNPYQVSSPWRYYTSYQPNSFGSFKVQNTSLPVELQTFTASISNAGVLLAWNTAAETNNYGFEIERKQVGAVQDGLSGQWLKVGFVKGHGTSNSPQAYSFTDAALAPGTYAYRLKQIDRDGASTYLPEVAVAAGNVPTAFALLQNYPNPFNPSTKIEYHVPAAAHVTLKVFDLLGREAAVLVNETKEAGNYTVRFNGKALSSGIYVYTMNAGGFTATKKFFLMK